ncbi:DNA polymerase sliding clamp [Sulfolobus acidocaldarius]|uniref:DNA polymerase sliding clamp 2 n=4 Tax=Sulfolobus acidocaldarius TaxID=2285 RepID=PCNA2_SULAC|nr:DNA polymerase sliding clamp [Sulfolobus acidocaldarius]Q4J9A8.1 RecName: Full=DNA polymerase sliding clamp 2; AltName: Full=Proliferating cell nuclear antigen homolog 2; Short=PCNA 2 [Sulfolobus acidocaldarius DSM 639]AAY80622.1 DNA polymerase sliding clamp C [Sulfolobus acidocaldarius DSM 639]AGE71214.1 DNA polymerase sliding clamp [Sulfolobus acidocaldarius N8]AGE73484.1 DNA polymerase sliding clamp [Sulfolobus acidocaldarius Ron12/I]ALU28527.1 DNA polymerase [Sulfolobus acidocaldarius]
MKVKVVDALGFSYIFKTLSQYVSEATLLFGNDGFKVKGMDPSKVVYIDIFVPKDYFEEYNLENEMKIGVSLKDVNEVIKNVSKEDILYLELEKDKIMFTLDGEYLRTFSLPVLSPDEVETPSINLEFPFRANILTSTFGDLLDEFDQIGGDSIRFKAQNGKLYLSVMGDMGESIVELSLENGGLLESTGTDAESLYGLEHVSNTTKMRRPSDTLEIAFGSQLPLKLRYNLPKGGYADFYIAPRSE